MADIPEWLRELEKATDPDATEPEKCAMTGGNCPADQSGCSAC